MGTKVRVVAGLGAGVLALASALLPSTPGVERIKRHEGVSLKAYPDAVQVPTICYGSTRGVFLGQHATLAECEQRLKEDATYAGKAVARYATHRLTQEQYDALVSFVFNLGETQFRKSTLLRKINAGDCYGAGAEFDRWVYAGGRKLRGLVKRRADERQAFESGCYAW